MREPGANVGNRTSGIERRESVGNRESGIGTAETATGSGRWAWLRARGEGSRRDRRRVRKRGAERAEGLAHAASGVEVDASAVPNGAEYVAEVAGVDAVDGALPVAARFALAEHAHGEDERVEPVEHSGDEKRRRYRAA